MSGDVSGVPVLLLPHLPRLLQHEAHPAVGEVVEFAVGVGLALLPAVPVVHGVGRLQHGTDPLLAVVLAV